MKWNEIHLGDNVFVGPSVTFTNDKRPRSKVYTDTFLPTRVLSDASIGAEAVILPGLIIGRRAMIGAGAVVTRDVPDDAVLYGNATRLHLQKGY